MKLILYEGYKLLKNHILLFLIGFLFIANLVIFYGTEERTQEYHNISLHKQNFTEFYNYYKAMNPKQRTEEFTDIRTIYDASLQLDSGNKNAREKANKKYEKLLKKYHGKFPFAIDSTTIFFIDDFIQQWNYQKNYDSFLNEMEQRKENMLTLSIFNTKGSFSEKNITKTAADFKHLQGTSLSLDNVHGILCLCNYQMTDYFLIFLVFLFCVELFYRERESSIFLLIKTKENGTYSTILSKYAILCLSIFGIGLLFYGSCIYLSGIIYGYGDLHRPIQSLPSFRNCILSLSVGQYLVVSVGMKIVTLFFLAALFSILFLAFKNKGAIYLSCIGILGIEGFLYAMISEVTVFNYFKCINLFYFLNPKKMVGTYLNLNFFGHPVEKLDCFLFFTAIGLLLCGIGGCLLFCYQMQIKTDGMLSRFLLYLRTRFLKMKGTTSLFAHELFKYMIQNGAIVPLFLLLFWGISSIANAQLPYYASQDEAVYGSYMKTIEGPVTPKTDDFILKERVLLGDISALLGDKVFELSEEEFQEVYKNTETYGFLMDYKHGGFEMILRQYNNLYPRREKGETVYLVNEHAMKDFFQRPQQDITLLIGASLCLIYLVSGIICTDYKNNMHNLQCATKNGRFSLFFRKTILAFSSTIFVWMIFYLPKLICFFKNYGFKAMGGQIQDIPFSTSQGSLTIGLAISMVSILRLTLILFFSSVIFSTSVYIKNHMLTLIICAGAILLPCIAVYQHNSLRFCHLLLTRVDCIWFFILFFIVLIALSIILWILSMRRFVLPRKEDSLWN